MSIRSIFTDYAIDAKYSDIIPQIQTMVSRLLHGQLPYQIIHFQNYDLFPTYQPLQWLPFTLAEWGHFDYRWIALAIWLLAVGVFVWKAVKIGHPMVYLQTALPFLFFIFIKAKEPTLFAWTMEIMIAGYYLLLALSISSRSIYIIAGGIILCLLSRYSLVFWLPLYFLVLLFSWNRQRTLMAAGLVLIGVLLIYVLPFLSQDAGIFIKGYQYHTGAALGEWQHYDGGTKPHHLFQGIGFACYFFDFAPGNLEQKLSLLKMVHLALSGSVVILLGLLYFFKLRTYLEPRRFLLASLNIYLVVFYSFIQIPYQYLMIVPLFASLPLLLPPAQLATAAAD
ncbi:MAG: hypothetical protein SFW35_03575 [Chitinophagales bacterium]|nr:hypothetical protein [Chitinophagales bacterium]